MHDQNKHYIPEVHKNCNKMSSRQYIGLHIGLKHGFIQAHLSGIPPNLAFSPTTWVKSVIDLLSGPQ